MLTTLTAGLNQRSTVGTYGLNPQRFVTVIVAGLAEVKVFTLGDGVVVFFVPEGMAFRPDIQVYHQDDATGGASVETANTGLSPQPDPAIARPPDLPMQAARDDGKLEFTETPETGLNPQADPVQLFSPDDK